MHVAGQVRDRFPRSRLGKGHRRLDLALRFRGEGDPVLYLTNPDGMSQPLRRSLLDDMAELNRVFGRSKDSTLRRIRTQRQPGRGRPVIRQHL